MATLEDILNGARTDNGGYAPPKGSQKWAEQNSGDNAPTQTTHSTATRPKSTTGDISDSYVEEYKKSNPYTPPTKAEIENEKKKQKRAQIFAAIGDGLAALSNLYFTSKGAPSMYDAKNTITGANKVRYDKLMKDRDEKNTAYFNGLMKAKQAGEAAADKERSWQRQLGLDEEARQRYNKEQEDKKAREKKEDERWQETFDENKRRADRSHNFQVKQHNDNVAVRREQAAATRAKGVRGKQLGFSDGKGNQVAIYENVWKGSMQQVYDAMLQDLAPTDEAERKRWERQMKKLDTPQKKEDYVKQNWHKSAKASQIMLTLSGIDPATMTSEVSSDEDYSQYEEANEEDYSQYEVKNN